MKEFTNKEAKAMRGTNFDVVASSGNKYSCYIAEVDLEKGLTCKIYKDGKIAKEGDELICVDLSVGGIHTRELVNGILNDAEKGLHKCAGGQGGPDCVFT